MNEPLGLGQGLIRLRGQVTYDGADFAGWGLQPDQRTVQGEMERAVSSVLHSERIVVTCAGRTDAGVHATGQVIHFDVVSADFPGVDRLRYRINAVLPEDIVVTHLEIAPANFDARFGALSRSYLYRIHDGQRDPLRRSVVYNHPWPLDEAAMQRAANPLLGLHDFAAFCRQREGASTIRDLQQLDFVRTPDGEIVVHVKADAFCHSMVRALVGAHISVGAGRQAESWPAELLAAGVRTPGVFIAPAHGLTLTEVVYPPDDELAARIAKTKGFRGSEPIS